MAARLREKYAKEVGPALRKEYGIDNVMAVPRLEKIILNMGLGEAVANPKILEGAAEELSAIAGQRAVVGLRAMDNDPGEQPQDGDGDDGEKGGFHGRILPRIGPAVLDASVRQPYLSAMAVLPIIVAPDPRLKVKCKPVERVDAEVRRPIERNG